MIPHHSEGIDDRKGKFEDCVSPQVVGVHHKQTRLIVKCRQPARHVAIAIQMQNVDYYTDSINPKYGLYLCYKTVKQLVDIPSGL